LQKETIVMPAIKAIPTRYRGYHFRSRLEARWAVFFDAAGVAWDYEPQGFQFPRLAHDHETGERYPTGDTLAYLPDFYLPGLRTYFEVKGERPEEGSSEYAKFHDFSSALPNEFRAVLAYGSHPDPDSLSIDGHPEVNADFDMLIINDAHYAWCVCPWCGKAGIEFDARGARVCGFKAHYIDEGAAIAAIKHLGHWRADDKCYTGNDNRIKAAYAAARSARFEHGESGAS